jgi:hypothetical protein
MGTRRKPALKRVSWRATLTSPGGFSRNTFVLGPGLQPGPSSPSGGRRRAVIIAASAQALMGVSYRKGWRPLGSVDPPRPTRGLSVLAVLAWQLPA